MKERIVGMLLASIIGSVVARGELIMFEGFDYPDGSLIDRSSSPWVHHSGTIEGEINVVGGQVELTESESEDVNAELMGGPFVPDSGGQLFASFQLVQDSLPRGLGNYFAHFRSGTTFAGRVFATTLDAAPDRFRLGVSNRSSSGFEVFDRDLSLNTPYLVVVRFDVRSAATTLWIDPLDEGDLNAVGADEASPTAVSSFALRQALSGGNGAGTLRLDDLKVGTEFTDVAGELSGATTVRITVSMPEVYEADDQPGRLFVTRTGDFTEAVIVRLAIGGDAVPDVDYEGLPDSVTIPPGGASVALAVIVKDDAELEAKELVTISIEDDPSYSIGTPGTATIAIVDDEMNPNSGAGVLLNESFSYPDGPIIGAPDSIWVRHSGIEGETRVFSGGLALDENQSEDFNVLLEGGPYGVDEGTVLFVGMDVGLSSLPGGTGNYFAHLRGGNSNLGRIFVSTLGAGVDRYRLGVSSGANVEPVFHGRDLELGLTYRLVMRFDLDSTATALWIDPRAEADPSVEVTEQAARRGVSAFAFRQPSSSAEGIGSLRIDELIVGTAFGTVVEDGSPPSPPTMDIRLVSPSYDAARERFEFVIEGEAGASCLVESSFGLEMWELLDTVTLTEERSSFVDDAASGGPRFYRVRFAPLE